MEERSLKILPKELQGISLLLLCSVVRQEDGQWHSLSTTKSWRILRKELMYYTSLSNVFVNFQGGPVVSLSRLKDLLQRDIENEKVKHFCKPGTHVFVGMAGDICKNCDYVGLLHGGKYK